MDLATRSKKFSFGVKALAIILSVIMAFGAIACGIIAYLSFDLFNDTSVLSSTKVKDDYQYDDVFSLYSVVGDNVGNIYSASQNVMNDDARKVIEAHREDFINNTLEHFHNEVFEYNQYNDYDYDYDNLYENAFSFYYTFAYKNFMLAFDSQFLDTNIYYNFTDDKVKEVLNSCVDSVLSADNLPITGREISPTFNSVNDGFYFYISNKTTGVTYNNLPNGVTKDDIATMPYAYSFVDGKEHYTEGWQTSFNNAFMPEITDDCEIHYYIDVNEGLFGDFMSAYKLIDDLNMRAICIVGVILAVLSVALAVFSFIIAGNRDGDGKIKLAFIDYVPNEIHIAASGFAGFGLFVAAVEMFDRYYAGLCTVSDGLIATFCFTGIWVLFIELVTSIVRLSKSDKHYYKNLLVVIIARVIYKPVKKLASMTKKMFKYNPQNFEKRIILWIITYAFANVFLFVMQIIWMFGCMSDNGIALLCGTINIMLLFAFNIASVVFVARYVVSLDKIITAMHNRTAPSVDYAKLPQSLKTLVDSVNVTSNELNLAVQKAVQDERMRTELITNVSHDLKTPLTSIINYVDLLKKCDINDESAREYISVLDDKGSKLKRLIEDLIEASKATSGAVQLNMISLNLSELATQAVVENQSDFDDNNLELIFKGDRNDAIAFCDGNKTYRVIENLLSNACKYSARASRVYADVYCANNTAIFEIKNVSAQPLDISPQELTERFVRGDKSRTADGNGLGLSIADNLCRAMGGRLELTIDGDLFKAKVILPLGK